MSKFIRVALALAAVLLVLAALAGSALLYWIGQDDFRNRVEREAGAALGVPLRLGRIHLDWFPVPAVALDDVTVQTQPPLSVRRIEARPVWSALLARRLEVATLVVRGAVVPQAGVDALLAAMQKRGAAGAGRQKPAAAPDAVEAGAAAGAMLWIPKRTLVEELTWVSSKGVSTVLDARAHLGDDGLPQDATIKLLKGPYEGASVEVSRDLKADAGASAGAGTGASAWLVDARIGGGTIKGRVALKPPSALGREMMLSGELETRGVEVAALTAPSRPLSGKLEASTALNARAVSAGGLADALQTRTRFTVSNAVVHGIDLAKAVSTVGLNRGGETALNELTGEVSTQGRAAQLRNLVARSGVLAARGDVSVSAAQALSGRVTVDVTAGVAGGLTGIPLVVGGTLNAPEVTLTRGAMLGAAVGTAVMPGVGTGAGAKLGDKLGRGLSGLFGGGK